MYLRAPGESELAKENVKKGDEEGRAGKRSEREREVDKECKTRCGFPVADPVPASGNNRYEATTTAEIFKSTNATVG